LLLGGIADLEWKMEKTWSTAGFTIHQRHENPELCSMFLLRTLRKT
jgi:hypothetical protein